ncbi:Dam family site-specific DNA-(adenine-N6)-methyltransferase [Pectinatus frisingensis]|uniref:Dam family site-specific DNA-(adenine-N6)-methyltransferase n=1 Tax=Pectinatus frisingensis TaxID=865 RepID=UPI001E45BEAF|nr:Dam family site-specific DNA-(adenine-N6)-methyltransferase [Pectinatus frisingensis]
MELRKITVKPLLKWAGGKTQLLKEIIPRMPRQYKNYIEPFIGGGALFFAVQPSNGIIADSNAELINVYQQVSSHVEDVIHYLERYENTEEMFYAVRRQEWQGLPPAEAAARMIYLNHTCFNGLYRVNKKGKFNVPFGHYKKPNICNADNLRAAAQVLQKVKIVCSDYLQVLSKYAKFGDFVFLDPPYIPVSKYADFKRYTKRQFGKQDQVNLADKVKDLQDIGCSIILTNSNHPMVHELYHDFKIDIVPAKRYISCNGQGRNGEDTIISIEPTKMETLITASEFNKVQVSKYPTTRFMGSKSKLLTEIWNIASQFDFQTAVDLFSGSGIVGYMMKAQGKRVISNDYMHMSAAFTKAMIENNATILSIEKAKQLLLGHSENDHFVVNNFQGLYFSDDDNQLIDRIRANIKTLSNPYEDAIARSALIRACFKKRPRGIFTYTGFRYDDGRKDLKKTMAEQFLDAVMAINNSVFDNGKKNQSINGDALELANIKNSLVYIDPPYYSPLSDNEYVRRYHFVEGLARDWKGVELQENTKTKKFKSYPTPFSKRQGAADAFSMLFAKYKDNILLVSYSSNSLPTRDEIVTMLKIYKQHVDVVPVNYRYSFGNQRERIHDNRNKVQEYLFIGY